MVGCAMMGLSSDTTGLKLAAVVDRHSAHSEPGDGRLRHDGVGSNTTGLRLAPVVYKHLAQTEPGTVGCVMMGLASNTTGPRLAEVVSSEATLQTFGSYLSREIHPTKCVPPWVGGRSLNIGVETRAALYTRPPIRPCIFELALWENLP
jgi:hypothetical protein